MNNSLIDTPGQVSISNLFYFSERMPPPQPAMSTARNSPVPFDAPVSPARPSTALTTSTGTASDFRAFQLLLLEDRRSQREELQADRLAMQQQQRERDDRFREEQRARDERFQTALLNILAAQQTPAGPALVPQEPAPPAPASLPIPMDVPSSDPGSPPRMEPIDTVITPPRREKVRSTTTGEKVCSSGGLRQGPSVVPDVVPASPPPSRKRRCPSPYRANARNKRIKEGKEYIPLDELDIAPTRIPMETLRDRQEVRDAFTKALTSIPGWFPLDLSIGAYVVIRFMYAHERARYTTYMHHCDKGHKQPDYRKPFHYYGSKMAQTFDNICQNRYSKVMDKPDLALKDFLPWFKKWNPTWSRPYVCSTTCHLKSAKTMRLLTHAGFLDNFLEDIGCPRLTEAEEILRDTDNAILPQDDISREFLDNYNVDEPSIARLWPHHLPRGMSKERASPSSSDSDGPGPSNKAAPRRKKARARKASTVDRAPAPTVAAGMSPLPAGNPTSPPVDTPSQPEVVAHTPPAPVVPTPGPSLPVPVVITDSPAPVSQDPPTQQDSSPVQFTSGSLSPASKQANLQDAELPNGDPSEGNTFSDTILDFCEELLK